MFNLLINEMTVYTIVGQVEFTVREPPIERRTTLIKNRSWLPKPIDVV